MESMSKEQICKMNLPAILSLAKEHAVPLEKCQNVEQFHERLLLHHAMLQQENFDMKKEFVVRPSETVGNERQTLDRLLKGVQKALEELADPAIEKALHIDSAGSDAGISLKEEIQAHRRTLNAAQCSVIVAGETNAGKSTLLNLILGMDILPSFILACTPAICVLRYAEVLRVQVVYRGQGADDRTFACVEEAHAFLNTVVAALGDEQRERQTAIEVINVYLPAVVLQSGVTLVDTPGIGENENMDRCTLDYVRSNSAAAYIYVIKTDNAGGVQDDRLLEFLRAILRHNEEEQEADVFDPTSAMFVCNRWDQIPKDQRDRIRQNAYSKLKDVWPRFDKGQAHFLSTTNSRMHWSVDKHYVTEDFAQVLRGMKEVFNKARQNAINHHYRWLKQILHQSTMFLQTTIAQCNQSDEELARKFRSTGQKLEALQTRTTETTGVLRRRLEEETLRLCDVIADILEEDDTRKLLEDWDLETVPEMPAIIGEEARRWHEDVDTMIIKRLVDIVNEQLQDREVVRQMEASFRQVAQKELKLVDEEIDTIVGDMKERGSLASSVSTNGSDVGDDFTACELLRLFRERNGVRLGTLQHISRVTAARRPSLHMTEETLNVPKLALKKVVARLLSPLASLTQMLSRQRRRSQFSNDPAVYLKDRGTKIATVMAKNRPCLEQMAYKHRERLDFFVMDIDNSIPRFVAMNKQLMDDIRHNRRQFLSQRRAMISVMEKLEPMRELLRGFGSLYIRDLTADNICLMLDAERRRSTIHVSVTGRKKSTEKLPDSGYYGSVGSKSTNGESTATRQAPTAQAQGLWNTYRWGHVTIGEEQEHVIGRTYIQGLPEEELIKEIARLRCLRSLDLAHFLGMSRMENTAVFLFLGDLISARKYLRRGFHEIRQSVPHILEGVLRGLDYLHREGLVHMALTLDTVMVTRDGDVKLCGACLPRHARFPPDADAVEARPFVYLSPEVLRGELYTADDDVYSFGIMTWETCLAEEPYSEQRPWSLDQFRSHVHPSSMLGLENMEHVSGGTLEAVLRGCLLPARGLRLKMDKLRLLAQDLRSDPAVLSLSSVSRRLERRRLNKNSRTPSDESKDAPWTSSVVA